MTQSSEDCDEILPATLYSLHDLASQQLSQASFATSTCRGTNVFYTLSCPFVCIALILIESLKMLQTMYIVDRVMFKSIMTKYPFKNKHWEQHETRKTIRNIHLELTVVVFCCFVVVVFVDIFFLSFLGRGVKNAYYKCLVFLIRGRLFVRLHLWWLFFITVVNAFF